MYSEGKEHEKGTLSVTCFGRIIRCRDSAIARALAQLMKGILFPDSNVLFFVQGQNPADVPPAKDPSTATDPLANIYGK